MSITYGKSTTLPFSAEDSSLDKLVRVVHGERPVSDFSVISNSVFRDERLSYRARGVLLEILTHDAYWAPDATEMSKRGTEGRDAIYACFDELESFGYLVRERIQGERGRWTTRTTFYANPQVAPVTGNQESVNQESVNQESARPAAMGVSAGRADYGLPGIGRPVIGRPGIKDEVLNEELNEELPFASLAALGDAAPVAVEPSGGKIAPPTKRGCRLPEPFPVDERMKNWFAENCHGVDGPHEHSQFCDYWWSASGSRATKVDWFRAWCVWMRKASKDTKGRSSFRQPASEPKPSTTDLRVMDALRLAEKYRKQEESTHATFSANGYIPGEIVMKEIE